MAIKIIAMLIVLFMPSVSWADTHAAATASYTDVAAAVAAATYGDTVTVPAGEATWDTTLTPTKGISIVGAGIGNTVITRSGSTVFIIDFRPDATTKSNDNAFEVSGFTFIGQYGIQMYDTVSRATPLRNIMIHGNRFEMSVAYPLYVMGSFWGAVYENEFAGTAGLGNWFIFAGHNKETFDSLCPATPGTADNLYIEDNVFTGNAKMGVQSGQGGRWVLRYNTYTITNIDTPLFDQHGCQGGTVYGLMLCEMYGNLFSGTGQNWWDYQRGGQLLMFNNRYAGPAGDPISCKQEYLYDFPVECPTDCTSEPPPNAYLWNNWYGGVVSGMIESTDNYGVIGENVTFWNYNAAFDGTVGIGAGTLGARPATCTTGVGYWATTYVPASTPPATMADMITYCQAGTFYKATATNTWTAWFAPYTYPHPLRGGTPMRNVVGSVNGGNGTCDCVSPVVDGDTTTCTMVPATGFHTESITPVGCTTDWVSGNSLTTGVVTGGNATVTATFAPDAGTGALIGIGLGGAGTITMPSPNEVSGTITISQ